MIIKDEIYGSIEIEPVLEELLNTKAVKRLKNVHQGGASYLVNSKWSVTRYDHSVGVMILIKIMGGSIEEQIAGLLHDISHTAFSHDIDVALKYSNEDYHEKIFLEVIEKSDIPTVLQKYRFDYKDILLNEEKWTILEKKAPDLCADRIDYTLRDMFSDEKISKENINKFINSLIIFDGEIVIDSLDMAIWFTELYYKEVIDYFMDPLKIYASDRLSKAIKLAIDNGEINLKDIMKTDDEMIEILEKSNIEEVRKLLLSIHNRVKVIEDTKEWDIVGNNKIRLIDPKVYYKEKAFKASEKSYYIKKLNNKAYNRAKEGTYVKIIEN
ncbi:HD domain-containing protein [Clostridium sardiniense]|uniref:HD domain-containing protein n=1 Tax=Clostridium sardiniense TaxID=29369 RepID=UPI003D342C91